MVKKPTARPANKPARAAVVSKSVRKSAKAKNVAEKPAAKQPRVTSKAGDPAIAEAASQRMRDIVAARKKTIAATMIYPGHKLVTPGTAEISDNAADQSSAAESVVRHSKAVSRTKLINRLARAVGDELDVIEKIIRGADVNEALRTDTERRARTLATLARTLGELKKLGGLKQVQGDKDQRPEPDDDRPRDLEELRQRLSERLARKIAGGPALPDGGNEFR